MGQEFVDRIYEGSFAPELWQHVARAEGRVGGRKKKLDVAKRREIAESVISGRKSGAEMACLYNVSQLAVSRIVAASGSATPAGRTPARGSSPARPCGSCPGSAAGKGTSMKRTWTIIGVADVPQSFKWYQSLLGLPETAPAHDYFGQIVDSDGTVLLCLHEWGAHEHPSLTSPHHAQPGNGLLLFVRVDNFDVALPRARALVSRLEEEPHVNPSTGTREFSLRDPDGYYVTISALSPA
jgi:catechol 2,3-dioxygenase-like lactoylglutathione lyase family enzyme